MAEVLAQKVSIQVRNRTFKSVIQQLQQQSGYSFVLDNVYLRQARPITLSLKNVEILDALPLVFANQPFDYQVEGKVVYFSPKLITHLIDAGVNVLQQRVIKGRVIDEQGNPLEGVTVRVKGTSVVSMTDADGDYEITVPNNLHLLAYSIVGFKSAELLVEGKSIVDVSLKAVISNLDEVAVIGYGTQSTRLTSTSMVRIGSEKISNRPVSNVTQALIGHTPGVWLQQVSGQPGTAPNIRIRGNGSITSGNSPLYVIDGFPTNDAGMFNSIAPSDIESVDILKDAAASAIYGSKAGNGVIIITTKKGKEGKTRFSFDALSGFESVSKKIDLLSPEQYLEIARESVANQGIEMPEYFSNPDLWTFTDWQDVIFRTAPVQSYRLGASGGTEKVRFNVSGGLLDQQGILLNSYMKRYHFKAGFDADLNRFLSVGVNINAAFSEERTQAPAGNNGVAGSAGVISYALSSPPILPVMKENGDYFIVMQEPLALQAFNTGLTNPLNKLDATKSYYYMFRQMASGFIELKPIVGLKVRSTLNVSYLNQKQDQYIEAFLAKGGLNIGNISTPDLAQISATRGNATNIDLYWSTIATYDLQLKSDHHFTTLLGYDVSTQKLFSTTVTPRTDVNTPVAFDNTVIKNVQGALLRNGSSGQSRYAYDGVFARLNYHYGGRYIISSSIRKDRSSRFGPGNRSGVFYSASAAWNASEEAFLENLAFLSTFKIRASYGETGNDQLGGNYPWVASLGTANYVFGEGTSNTRVPTYFPGGFSNRGLQWEKNRQIDIGLDLGFLNERIQLTADVYRRRSNTILSAALPIINGKASSVIQNVGLVQNKGLELDLNTRNLAGAFKWNSSLNWTLNRNLIVKLTDDQTQLGNATAGSAWPGVIRNYVGRPMGDLYMYVVEGTFNNEDDLANYPKLGTQLVGDLRFRDVNGDGTITAEDLTLVGNYQPKFFFGINNTFSYRDFDLGILLDGIYGNKVINLLERPLATGRYRENLISAALDRWQSEDEPGNGTFPRLGNPHGTNVNSNTRFLYDGSFLRIRNLTLGYTLPARAMNRLDIHYLRIFLVAQNLFTFTQYTGYNPEANVSGDSATNNGVDEGSYPLARNFSIGVNLSF